MVAAISNKVDQLRGSDKYILSNFSALALPALIFDVLYKP